MAQASAPFQQFVSWLQTSTQSAVHSEEVRSLVQQIKAMQGWLIATAGLLALLLWNWQLVLALAAGLLVLLLVYLGQTGYWKLPAIDWQRLWNRSNRPLTLALLSGGLTALGLYSTIAIWRESGGSWLAGGLILQGLGTVAILLLLGWQATLQQRAGQTQEHGRVDRLMADLTDSDPVKRLLAVRRLAQWTSSATADSPDTLPPAHLVECFRLMLNRETEPAVCSALLDSLQLLGRSAQLQAGQQPVMSATVSRQPVKVRQQAPEL